MSGPQDRAVYNALVNTGTWVYTTYPTAVSPLANVTGVALTADAAGSKYGATAEIIAAAAITTVFWVAGVSVNTLSAADQLQVRLSQGAGDGTVIAETGIIDGTAVTVNAVPIWFPFPIRLPANTRVGARLAVLDAIARTVNCSVMVGTNTAL